MQLKYRSYQRAGGVFYWQENGTANRGSLRTKDRAEAQRLLQAMNEAHKQPTLNLALSCGRPSSPRCPRSKNDDANVAASHGRIQHPWQGIDPGAQPASIRKFRLRPDPESADSRIHAGGFPEADERTRTRLSSLPPSAAQPRTESRLVVMARAAQGRMAETATRHTASDHGSRVSA